MRSRLSVLAVSLMFGTMGALLKFALAAPPAPSAKDVAAQVNERSITYQELNTEFRARTRVPFEKVQADPQAQHIRKQVLEQIINEELLLKEAERQKRSVPPADIDKRFKQLQARFPAEEAFSQELKNRGLTAEQLKQNIKRGLMRQQILTKEVFDKVSVSPKELEAFFNKNKNNYVQQEEIHARHILIRVDADASPEDDRKAKDRANAVLVKAKKGKDFGQLAKEHSDGPTKEREGDLGYFGRGQMVKPFAEAAFSLKVGQVSDLVRTKFGYHIIKVEDRREAKRLSYKQAENQVKDDLTKEKVNARYQEYIDGLRKKAKITIHLT